MHLRGSELSLYYKSSQFWKVLKPIRNPYLWNPCLKRQCIGRPYWVWKWKLCNVLKYWWPGKDKGCTVVLRVLIDAKENLTKNFSFHKGNQYENCQFWRRQKAAWTVGENHYQSVRKTWVLLFSATFCYLRSNFNCQVSILAKNPVGFCFGACCVIEIFKR